MALYAFDGTWDKPDVRAALAVSSARAGRGYEPSAPSDSENTNVILFGAHYDPDWSTDDTVQSADAETRNAFYTDGVGTRFTVLGIGQTLGGLFGAGGKRRVRKMYGYLCRRHPHDPIIDLVGFSRGAATAVHFANTLAEWGVADPADKHTIPRWSKHLGWSRFKKPPAGAPRPSVRFVGLFDEVATFGLPIKGLRNRISVTWFVKTLPDIVERSFHAMALDEVRRSFELIDPEPVDPEATINYSVWFRGVHRNIGGGHPDRGLSDITLIWMLEMLVYAIERQRDPAHVPPSSVIAALDSHDQMVIPLLGIADHVTPFRPDPNGFIPRKASTKRTAWRTDSVDGRLLVHHTAEARSRTNPADFYGDNLGMLVRIPANRELVYDAPLLREPTPRLLAVEQARRAFRSIPVRPRAWLKLGDDHIYRSDHFLGIGTEASRYETSDARSVIAASAFIQIVAAWLLAGAPDDFDPQTIAPTPRSREQRQKGTSSYEEFPTMTDAELTEAVDICCRIFKLLEAQGQCTRELS